MTALDLLNTVLGDQSTVAADQTKLTADQATQATDDATFVSKLQAAGVTSFSVVSADGNSVDTYTVQPNQTPPFSVATTPTAGSININ
jgi:hypothetical protein